MLPIICAAIFAVVPAHIIYQHFSPNAGFTDLIYFGQFFNNSTLPEIRALNPHQSSSMGYDGQFYAQLALRPTLGDPALVQALDNPAHRARRIGLPLLAWFLGIGRPAWVLQTYALLNALFWLVLLVAIYRIAGTVRPKSLLLAEAMLWSSGTLISITRALPDLPAAALGVLALCVGSTRMSAALLFSAAGLIKETAILSATALLDRTRGIKKSVAAVLIVLVPLALWLCYVNIRLQSDLHLDGTQVFALPLYGLGQKLYAVVQNLAVWHAGTPITTIAARVFELLCPLSLAVQALYLTTRPRTESATWRFGILFAVLLCVLGTDVWVEQYGYTRILLPLTFAFNLLLYEHESRGQYACWYVLGNCGMCRLVLEALL